MDVQDLILQEVRDLRKEHAETRNELKEFRASQREICCAASRQRDEHHRTLYGNGKAGLVSVLQDVVTRLVALEKQPRSVKAASSGFSLTKTQIVSIVGAVTAVLLAIEKFILSLIGS